MRYQVKDKRTGEIIATTKDISETVELIDQLVADEKGSPRCYEVKVAPLGK